MASARTRKDEPGRSKPAYGPNVEPPLTPTTPEQRAADWERLAADMRSLKLASDGEPYYGSRDDLYERD
ncbi:hypothetical protein [Chthonobacter albigriseus]|uniref:hypothetical protein n=1 Tax=Chthonobacter albigriseus TaxID=1683161 RepID=UPI0015EF3236|nr:hypothetical protein [Chthonobacter albigriseus]